MRVSFAHFLHHSMCAPFSTQAESAWDIPYHNRKMFLFHYQIFKSYFFVINYSPLVIRFLLNSSIVKSDNEKGKVNDKKIDDLKI
jgi:hypothetical protein